MSPFRVGKRKAGEANRREAPVESFTTAPPPAPTVPVRVPEVRKVPLTIDVKRVELQPDTRMKVEVVTIPSDKDRLPEGHALAVITTWFKVNGHEFAKGDTVLAPAPVLAGWGAFLKLL